MVREILDRILYGYIFADIDGLLLKIKPLPLSKRCELSFLKGRRLDELRAAGVPSEKELIEQAIASDNLSKDYDKVLEKLKLDLDIERENLSNERNLIRKKKIQASIADLEGKIRSIEDNLLSIKSASLEYLSDLFYATLYIDCAVFLLDGTPYHINHSDISSFNKIMSLIGQQFEEKDVRKVARSSEWRLIWKMSKYDMSSVFGPLNDLTIDQTMLVYWSYCYDRFFEDPENDISIVDDDEKFDAWLSGVGNSKFAKSNAAPAHQENGTVVQGYYSDKCTCGVGTKKTGLGEVPIHKNDCEFGKYFEYTKVEKAMMINKIYNKNSQIGRQRIDKQHGN